MSESDEKDFYTSRSSPEKIVKTKKMIKLENVDKEEVKQDIGINRDLDEDDASEHSSIEEVPRHSRPLSVTYRDLVGLSQQAPHKIVIDEFIDRKTLEVKGDASNLLKSRNSSTNNSEREFHALKKV